MNNKQETNQKKKAEGRECEISLLGSHLKTWFPPGGAFWESCKPSLKRWFTGTGLEASHFLFYSRLPEYVCSHPHSCSYNTHMRYNAIHNKIL